MLTPTSVVTICQKRKMLQTIDYILYVLSSLWLVYIMIEILSLFIPFTYHTHSPQPLPNVTTSHFSGSRSFLLFNSFLFLFCLLFSHFTYKGNHASVFHIWCHHTFKWLNTAKRRIIFYKIWKWHKVQILFTNRVLLEIPILISFGIIYGCLYATMVEFISCDTNRVALWV